MPVVFLWFRGVLILVRARHDREPYIRPWRCTQRKNDAIEVDDSAVLAHMDCALRHCHRQQKVCCRSRRRRMCRDIQRRGRTKFVTSAPGHLYGPRSSTFVQTMERLLDFSQRLDVALLDHVVEVFYNPAHPEVCVGLGDHRRG